MEGIGLVRTIDVASGALLVIAGATVVAGRVRVRVRTPVPGGKGSGPRWLTRMLSALGFLVALASPAGAAGRRDGSPLTRSSRGPKAPWSETSGFPPPLPLVRTGATGSGAPSPDAPWEQGRSSLHPAVHTGRARSARITPLFPRGGRSHAPAPIRREGQAEEDVARSKADSMRMHPAGKGLPPEEQAEAKPHHVSPGESLWTIAEDTLGTSDPIRIARYWHKIHSTNRAVIGADPNLLLPGQQLILPAESAP